MSSQSAISVGGIVLCGGKSTRMGKPKLSLPFGVETMLQRVVRILSDVVSPIVVVAATSQELPALPGSVLIARDEHDSLGPLAGIAVGLELLSTKVDAAYVTSCDAPLLKPEFVRAMIAQLGPHDLAIPGDGEYHHPLAGVYRTMLAGTVSSLVAARRLRPVFLLDECDARIVDVDDLREVDPCLDSLRNTNTEDEYRSALVDAFIVTQPTPTPAPTNRDVRMRGFAERALVETALEWINVNAGCLESETIGFRATHGRVLSRDVLSGIDVPSFDRAAMDGYALRGSETTGAGDYNPLSFVLVGESMPGRPFEGEVAPGQAVRIMTGSPMPSGANAVVPAEFACESLDRVELTAAASPGKHVGRRGEDVCAGSLLFSAGRKLRPQDVGLLASVGIGQVDVVRRPRVRLLMTGNELVEPGETRGPYQIYESNSSMLEALLERDGGEMIARLRVDDSRDSVRNALLQPGADVMLVSGGSSVGREDYAPPILAAEGELAFHGIAMRPSSPAGMGRLGAALVFLLPGNPVSCLCAYDFFAGRAIRLMEGRKAQLPYATVQATVAKKIVSAIGRVDYCRVAIDRGQLEPLAVSGAGILSSTTRADGFVIVPAESEGYAPGAIVTAYLYDA